MMQLLTRQEEEPKETELNYQHWKIAVNREIRKTICPFQVEKCLKNKYNINREDLNATQKGFLLKTETSAQVEGLLKMNTLVPVPCPVTKHSPVTKHTKRAYLHSRV